ncbi:unnamed protein product [Brassicogethes aeneus]|uniref:Intraflagellar transport protein 43 homolog n=1 Tax=Brassicogethes aeneus TaxID=1431903 RepID=A0A9P0FMI6_BRAAE|nr:unnamed protein product [Brassicogethes aeneus]
MNWDEDIDLLGGKKSGVKQGRRSSKNLADDLGSTSSTPREVPIKTGVWTDEGSKSNKNKGSNIIEQERFQKEKIADSDDDIPIIPEIDDLQDDPLNLPDVRPMVTVNKSTYKELDDQFENIQSEQVNFGNLGDIDLSYFTSKLNPEKNVEEPNEIWTMDSLFEDLARTATF